MVAYPENEPENAVAVRVPVDGTYDNEPLEDKPVPVVVVAAPAVICVIVVAVITIVAAIISSSSRS